MDFLDQAFNLLTHFRGTVFPTTRLLPDGCLLKLYKVLLILRKLVRHLSRALGRDSLFIDIFPFFGL
jgi:hypothetical protein